MRSCYDCQKPINDESCDESSTVKDNLCSSFLRFSVLRSGDDTDGLRGGGI